MKIAASSLQQQVQHESSRVQTSSTRVSMWLGDRPVLRQAAAPGPAALTPPTTATPASIARRAGLPVDGPPLVFERPRPLAAAAAAPAADDPLQQQLSPYMVMVTQLIEQMTGVPALGLRVGELGQGGAADQSGPAQLASAQQPARAGWGLELEQQQTLQESETLQWSAQGVVRTADGQELAFRVELQMQRSYAESSQTLIRMGDAVQMKDLLVINFDGSAAQLQDRRFAFDLDGDGQQEQVPLLAGMRGFLALDGNGNQRIDDGRELFGPQTGDGFAELAAHDQDGNGWIDEGDAVYSRLRVWLPQEDGPGQLLTLKELDIGAISLAAARTPFALRGAGNQALGQVQASSVYLRDSGGAGSVQHVDVTA